MTTDAARDAATRVAILKTLADEVKGAYEAARAECLAGMSTGDRLSGRLPSGELAGRVRVDAGSVVPYVADERELLRHVRATAPTEVETVTVIRVRPAYVGVLLDRLKKAGEATPGLDVRVGDPKVVLSVDARDRAAIKEAWADGSLRMADVVRPALPATEGREAA